MSLIISLSNFIFKTSKSFSKLCPITVLLFKIFFSSSSYSFKLLAHEIENSFKPVIWCTQLLTFYSGLITLSNKITQLQFTTEIHAICFCQLQITISQSKATTQVSPLKASSLGISVYKEAFLHSISLVLIFFCSLYLFCFLSFMIFYTYYFFCYLLSAVIQFLAFVLLSPLINL